MPAQNLQRRPTLKVAEPEIVKPKALPKNAKWAGMKKGPGAGIRMPQTKPAQPIKATGGLKLPQPSSDLRPNTSNVPQGGRASGQGMQSAGVSAVGQMFSGAAKGSNNALGLTLPKHDKSQKNLSARRAANDDNDDLL